MKAMRIDSHQHYWDLTKFNYGWMGSGPSPLKKNFLPGDLEPILEQNRFDGTVVVQANTDPGEVTWLMDLAKQHKTILGVVGWVDLLSPKLGNVLDELQKNPLFKGVRHPVHDEKDDDWLMRSGVLNGLKELERRKIPFDLLLRPQHFKVVEPLAERLPNLNLVLDHLGKPNIALKQWDLWADYMVRFQKIPRMHVKVSGMVTEAAKEWKAEDLRPYVQHVWKVFGPSRLMFGSDWPVCTRAGSWKQVLAAFTQALGAQSMRDREQILGATAARFYGIKLT